jgi:hypothetical protein
VIKQSPEPKLADAAPPAVIVPVSVKAPQGEIAQEFVQRVAIADDASWIIGQLFYIHAGGGLWIVRYAPLDKEDRYGGGVVLAKGTDMAQFREGDLVYVRGAVLNEGRASKYVGGPLYRATSVTLNERLDQ